MIKLTTFIAQTGSGGSGIDTATLVTIVVSIAGALLTIIGILLSFILRRIERENEVLREKLAKYEVYAPDFIAAVEAISDGTFTRPSGAVPTAPRSPSRMPYPLGRATKPGAGRRRRRS